MTHFRFVIVVVVLVIVVIVVALCVFVCVYICAAPYLMSLLSSQCLTATPPFSNVCRALKANSIKSNIYCGNSSKQK